MTAPAAPATPSAPGGEPPPSGAPTVASPDPAEQRLRRELGVPGAVVVGLGSIVGTGVFASLAVAAGVAGPAVLAATALAALVALASGLSSAQLAASHPVSGGTYEYGYRYLTPRIGFVAGWMFLCAKSASAATAALAFAAYLIALAGAGSGVGGWLLIALAIAAVAALAALIVGGLRRTSAVNTAIVSLAVGSLVVFAVAGARSLLTSPAPAAVGDATSWMWPEGGLPDLLHATALMFVAFTGYGRIATMGEEVRAPERTIPRAVVVTLAVAAALYIAVAAVAVAAVGAPALATAVERGQPPLEIAAHALATSGVPEILALGALAAMLGVLLNLLLGLSRVLLAMGRRGDMPRAASRLDASGSPRIAVLASAAIVAGLACVGDIGATWSFSAFTVLVYYALTNLAALRLPAQARRYPRAVAAVGLAACLSLAFWVDRPVWMLGLALLAAGLVWRLAIRRLRALRTRGRPGERAP